MRRGHWQIWRPRHRPAKLPADSAPNNLFLKVRARLERLRLSRRAWRKRQDLSSLDAIIDGARGHAIGLDKQNAPALERAEAWLYALALQAPRAAVAQEQMDKNPRGYHDKEHRLLQLVDFNDAFDSAVLALPYELLPRASEEIKLLIDFACKKAGTRCFSNEQYSAITRGLSREIAVFLGLKKEGFEVEMTNRHEDVFGIDMFVTDRSSLKTVGIDIKTRSSYYYRIQQLEREGRLSEEGFLMADRNGFTAVMNGRGSARRQVVTWRIDTDTMGEIVNFEFKNTSLLGQAMRVIMLRYGERV